MARLHSPSLLVGGLLGALAAFLLLSPEEQPAGRNPTERERSTEPNAKVVAEEPAPIEETSPEDATALLASSRRLDQVRAIEAIRRRGTPDAAKQLLDRLLAAEDSVLAGLLQEALLDLDADLLPMLEDAFLTAQDAPSLHRLANLLYQASRKSAESESATVEFLIEALGKPGPDREREFAARNALRRIGIAAVAPVAKLFADPHTSTDVAGSAAWILAHVDKTHAKELQHFLDGSARDLTKALEDTTLSGAQREDLREKTQWLSWTAANRPKDEHDMLAKTWLDRLLPAKDAGQANRFAWGIANLEGMSDAARLQTTETILAELPNQTDPEIRQWYVWTVANLAEIRGRKAPLDAAFYRMVELAEAKRDDAEIPADARQHFEWLVQSFRSFERKQKARR